jgi:hypothetical protein
MLLRSLEPNVMLLRGQGAKTLGNLPFLAVHIPLRKTQFAAPELNRLAGYAAMAIGEHLLVMQIMFRVASLLRELAANIELNSATKYYDRFNELYVTNGGVIAELSSSKFSDVASIFAQIEHTCEIESASIFHTTAFSTC